MLRMIHNGLARMNFLTQGSWCHPFDENQPRYLIHVTYVVTEQISMKSLRISSDSEESF